VRAGSIDKVEHRCLLRDVHRERLRQSAMRPARARHEHVLFRIGHSAEDALGWRCGLFERDECFQLWIERPSIFTGLRRNPPAFGGIE